MEGGWKEREGGRGEEVKMMTGGENEGMREREGEGRK